MIDALLDTKEISLISKIARAHGGKTATGSKDTIGDLHITSGVDHVFVRQRQLAAVLRLSDELAENSKRANQRQVEESKFPNLFCETISVSVDYENRRISLDFFVADEVCNLQGKDENGEEMYFLDYISKRIGKAELERRYCDRFLRGFCTFEEIRVTIEFVRDDVEWKQIHFEMKEEGYPSAGNLDDFRARKINGEEIANLYQGLMKLEEEDA